MICVTNNSHASDHFEIFRGIRQGCPLSALLFLLVAEIMAISIRGDDEIKGIKVGKCTLKITQMADDTTLFVQDTRSVQKILEQLYYFSLCAGLILNKEKTEAVQLGIPTNKFKD